MKISRSLIAALTALLLAPAAVTAADANPNSNNSKDEAQIRSVLDAQATDWNRGAIESFVQGYWKSDDTVFVGASGVKRGWQSILDRYRREYPDRKAMGHLAFSNLEVHVTCADSAYAVGEFELERQAKGESEVKAESKSAAKAEVVPDSKTEKLSGFFTLYLRKFSDKWLIVADHTTRKASPGQ